MTNKKGKIETLFYNDKIVLAISFIIALLIWLLVVINYSPETTRTIQGVKVNIDTTVPSQFGLEVFDSGTSMFHDEILYNLKNPYLRESLKIKAKPFASNQKEQMKRIPFKEYCSVLDFERLDGVSEFFGKLISQNPYIEPERAEILCKTLDSRIKETERLFEN